MKYIVILGDGMSDLPVPGLGGRTPLMVAKKPNRTLAKVSGGSCQDGARRQSRAATSPTSVMGDPELY